MSANIPGFHVQMKWIGKPSGIKKKRLRNICCTYTKYRYKNSCLEQFCNTGQVLFCSYSRSVQVQFCSYSSSVLCSLAGLIPNFLETLIILMSIDFTILNLWYMLLGCYWYMYPWQRALDFVRYFDLSLRGIFQRM